MIRIRLKLSKSKMNGAAVLKPKPRPNDYLRLRMHWLHELRITRSKIRITGTASKKDVKIIQRELARIRATYV